VDDTVTFDVEGMTCASCALRIERVLGKQEGVDEAVVNFAGQEARARVGNGVDLADLQAAISRIGYEITPIEDRTQRVPPAERYAEDARYQRRNVVLAAVLTVPVMVLSMLGPDTAWSRTVQAVLTTIVVFGLGAQFHAATIKQLRGFSPAMDTLVTVGTITAWAYSMWALLAGEPVYFETAAMITTLILLGRYFEARAKGRASRAVTKLLELSARQARVIRGNDTIIPRGDSVIKPGDHVVAIALPDAVSTVEKTFS